MLCRVLARSSLGLALGLFASVASAEEQATSANPSQQDIEAWLATKPASADVSQAPAAPEAPPPPPRRRGVVVESSIGAMGQVGALQHVSATAPWFRAAVGYEPLKWLMILAQGDVAFASTALANPPPDPRGYALWGLSAAARFGFEPARAIGLYAQGELGIARVTTDVLGPYGFKDADSLGPFLGALIGVEWYQVSPHYALGAQGGLRTYGAVLDRSIGGAAALAWTGSASLKYVF